MLVSRVDGCVGMSGGGLGSGGGVWGVEAGVWGSWLGMSCTMSVVCSQLVLHAPPTLPRLPRTPFTTSQTAAVFCNIAVAFADSVSASCTSLLGASWIICEPRWLFYSRCKYLIIICHGLIPSSRRCSQVKSRL